MCRYVPWQKTLKQQNLHSLRSEAFEPTWRCKIVVLVCHGNNVASIVCLQISRESPLSSFNRYRALVLDTSYRPIDIVNWQRAICLDLFDKVCVPVTQGSHLLWFVNNLIEWLV